ncbi:oxidoreductase [Nocardioides sp. SOB77]|uniref:Oxidoreductase n=1 Tax=Nocardioides oceani TaxID=3058369 RepID=A0ABT8FFY8_9ACTN|nr:oxidoreductase [Nocardioides oceani]MDN4173360.1 oxidoreductase [Nocardioides oceani]
MTTDSTQQTALGGTFELAPGRTVHRMGYGAMQLAGPGVLGPPADPDAALAVLREARALGIDHVDTSDFYGPHVTNRLIREALHPYAEDLVVVTKVGGRRDDTGAWLPAQSPEELRRGVLDNLENLGLEAIDVVNLRVMDEPDASIGERVEAMAELQREGLVGHLGLSTVSAAQVAEAQRIAPVVCVQNHYNLAHREDDELLDALAEQGVAYVPYFPLGGFSPLQSAELDTVAARVGASPMAVALAWLLQRSPNVLLIPGTSSVAHLRQNVAAADLVLSADDVAALDRIGG